VTPDAARLAERREFGGVSQIKEAYREHPAALMLRGRQREVGGDLLLEIGFVTASSKQS
jgi:hypothetical protein